MVRKGGRLFVSDEGDLKISDIGLKDAGEYVCEIDGEEVHYKLEVLGKQSESHPICYNQCFHSPPQDNLLEADPDCTRRRWPCSILPSYGQPSAKDTVETVQRWKGESKTLFLLM